MKKKTTMNSSRAVRLTILGASLAGMAASAYFLLGPNGKRRQRHAKAWAIKMKGDIVERLEMARAIDPSLYHGIIDSVAAKYEKKSGVSRVEVRALARDLKKHWKTLSASTKARKRTTKAVAKRKR